MSKRVHTLCECRKCGRPVDTSDGYPVHLGGGAYWQRCKSCGWHGSKLGSYKRCPECQKADLVDDHCVIV